MEVINLLPGEHGNISSRKLRAIDPTQIISKSPKFLRSSIMLPSQYNSYAVCTEFARDWFLEKFNPGYFNSIFIDGSKSFDQFRMFSTINEQLKRRNPLLAIIPTIDITHNRNFIDTNMELSGYLRRSRMEGVAFADKDPRKALHLAVQFKTILMNFTYRIRVDTKAQQLDMVEFLKYKHRAGMSESQVLPLEIHVPKKIISQIAFDNGFAIDDFSGPVDIDNMLRYLNSHAIAPFLYKRRNATGNGEYFLHIDNCVAHLKSEFPTIDENGERQDAETTNYTIDFTVEIEMTAPYCYTYYSQYEHSILSKPSKYDDSDSTAILLMKAAYAEFPPTNEVGWDKLLRTEYIVENEDLKDYVKINFEELFHGELLDIINYTKSIYVSPSMFIDFIVYNNTDFKKFHVDWDTNEIVLEEKCTHPGFIIGIYVNMHYVNEVRIHHNNNDGWQAPDSFRTASRIGKIDKVGKGESVD